MFLKKSVFAAPDNSFRFNFSNPEQGTSSSADNCVNTESANKTYQFEPSNNEFRFNFSSGEQTITCELENININSEMQVSM